MNVDELIVELRKLNGKLLVVANDGADPSDLNEISRLDVEELSFFRARSFDYETCLVVHLN